MTEIIWHGRGGQGAFTAAKILGTAWSLKNDSCFALSFPSFGPERRGAPVRAFTKLGCGPVSNRCEVKECDYIIYLDDTLFNERSLKELKTGGKILVNTKKQFQDPRIIAVDGSKIAEDMLGIPIANTVMLGALSGINKEIELPALEEAVELNMAQKLVKSNIALIHAAREGYGMKPYLRKLNEPLTLADYPENCAYEAGFLVTKNAGWRSKRPVIDDKRCTVCLQCYLHCPEGVIFEKEKTVDIDYDFCKGCGICKKICSFNAIEMEDENP